MKVAILLLLCFVLATAGKEVERVKRELAEGEEEDWLSDEDITYLLRQRELGQLDDDDDSSDEEDLAALISAVSNSFTEKRGFHENANDMRSQQQRAIFGGGLIKNIGCRLLRRCKRNVGKIACRLCRKTCINSRCV